MFHYNTLSNMYFKFNRPEYALNVFDEMQSRNHSSWNTAISGCVRSGLFLKSVEIFRTMREYGVDTSAFILSSLLSACNRCSELLELGVLIHGLALKIGLLESVYVSTSLLHLYGSNGLVVYAQELFGEMAEKNVVSWTALMVGYSKNGKPEDAVRAYKQMRREGVECNQNSFASVISSCALLESEKLGLQVVAHALCSGFGTDVSVANSIINLFDSLERVKDAERLFDMMDNRDTISWNSMTSAYGRGSLLKESFKCFSEMQRVNVQPDATTLCSLISACSCVGNMEWGQCLHGLAIKEGLSSSISVCNTLITMYSISGNCDAAELLFQLMPEKDLISWNSMISCYVESGHPMRALKVLAELLQSDNEVSHVTFASALSACSNPESLEEGRIVHSYVVLLGLHENLFLSNALITMYSNCNAMREAELVWRKMPKHDLVTWNALIGGYAENEEQMGAVKTFLYMTRSGIRGNYITMVNILGACSSPQDLLSYGMPLHAYAIFTGLEMDEYVKNSTLTMYSKCGDFTSSEVIFNDLDSKTAASWNAMISSKAHHGHGEDALKLFMEMRHKRVNLDQFSLSAGFAASTSLASLEEGQQFHGLIIKLGFHSDPQVLNSAMDMYGKCGSMDDMLKLLPEPNTCARQSWNIIISAYARHGYFEKAEDTFNQMLQIGPKPDYVTFVSLLSACNHAGLVDKGLAYYRSMISEFGISPRMEHFVCVVDLLGRSGKLMEAEKFIEEMPIQPNDLIWRSLLASSRIHKNMEIGRKAAECLIQLDPTDDSAYVLLSNVCATSGMWEDVERLRKRMKSIKVSKRPACSWIKVKNKVSSFGSGDFSHPLNKQICLKLNEMLNMVKELGYVADTSFTLHDIDEEQKERNLWGHSEKIALAYGLIGLPEGSPIKVFKNLRACGDCHTVFKLISKAVSRDILLRDPYRYHHFKDGVCSCSDFW